jgi:hypothetical protein
MSGNQLFIRLWRGGGLRILSEAEHRVSQNGSESQCSVNRRGAPIIVVAPHICMCKYKGVFGSSRTGRLERELQMVQFSATRCSCIAILWVSLVSFAAMTLCVVLKECLLMFISLWLSPETFGYTLVCVCIFMYVWIYEGRSQSSWTHLITLSRNFVEVRWRSLFRSTSLGKRCNSYNAPPTSRKRAADR